MTHRRAADKLNKNHSRRNVSCEIKNKKFSRKWHCGKEVGDALGSTPNESHVSCSSEKSVRRKSPGLGVLRHGA
jgi:hypothetical protein